MKDWRTTVSGVFAGVPQIIQGIVSPEINWNLVISGLGTIAAFFFAKDFKKE